MTSDVETAPTSEVDECPVLVGDVIAGKYRVEDIVGRGGMGVVCKATHLELGQHVALKLLRYESRELASRFLQEARAIVQLKSDHVVRVFDLGRLETGQPFLVLEYLEGETLAELLERRGPFSPREAARIGVEACRALEEAHGLGIIHRDVKPSNLFWAKRADGTHIVKLLDFGASKLQRSEHSHKTTHGVLVGSPAFASPEQLTSPDDLDGRADLWALGVTLYTLVTGETPFDAATVPQVFMRIMSETPTRLHVASSAIDPAFSAVVAKCLEKDRADRHPTASALATALAPFAADGPLALAAAPTTLRLAPSRPASDIAMATTTVAMPGPPVEEVAARRARVVAVLGLAALVVSGVAVTVGARSARRSSVAAESAPASASAVTVPITSADPPAPSAGDDRGGERESVAPPTAAPSAATARRPPRLKAVAPSKASSSSPSNNDSRDYR